ncbi:hypothetical protein QEN19_000540 [Hanseniaspora menglaensis]
MTDIGAVSATQLIQKGSKHYVKDDESGRLIEVERSCEMCRKRKKKCSKTYPCTTCIKFQLECVYKPKEEKTPLTRARMTSLESSIGKISKILKTVVDDKSALATMLETYGLKADDLDDFEKGVDELQDIDIDLYDNEIIQKPSSPSILKMEKIDPGNNNISVSDKSEELKLLKQIKGKVKKIKRNGIKGQEKIQITDSIQSYIPNDELNGFDWIEIDDYSIKNKNDGMAALSVNPNNTGYFGQGSSANMLRTTLLISGKSPQSGEHVTSEVLKVSRELADELRSFEVRESLINSYFAHYHTSYPFVDRDWFLRRFMASKDCNECINDCKPLDELLIKENVAYSELKEAIENEDWKILLNTVCALGAWCLQSEVSAMANMDLFYYKEAKNLIKGVLFERGSIHLVTAFTLMSNYTQKRDKPNTGWNYLGIASRMAIGLGLYKELGTETKLDNKDQVMKQKDLNLEMRRRLWWGLYMFDVGTAITFGRPVNFPVSANFDIRLPKNMDDCGCDLKETPTIYSGLIEQSKFTGISLDIHSKLLSSQPPSSKECLKLNEKIEGFVEQLPRWFNKDNNIAFPCCEEIFISENSVGSVSSAGSYEFNRASGDSLDQNPLASVYSHGTGLKKIPEWFHLTKYRLVWRVLNLQIILFQNFVWQDIMGRNESKYTNYIRTHPSMKKCINACLDSCEQSIESVKEFVDAIIQNKKYDLKTKELVKPESQHFVTSPKTMMRVLGDAAKRSTNHSPQSINEDAHVSASLKQGTGFRSSLTKTKEIHSNNSNSVLASLSATDYSNTTGSTSPELTTNPHLSMLASWYATYFLFQATIVPMICLIYNDENCNLHQWNSWKKQVNTARECFGILSESNKTAADFLKIIDDMCGNILKEESAVPFSPAPEAASNDVVPLLKETSPYAIGSVYNNNNIFDANGKIRAENSSFAVGTPFDRDLKMTFTNSNNSYFVNKGNTPMNLNGFSLTTPYITKGPTSDIRANSRPATPSMISLLSNDQQPQAQFDKLSSNKKLESGNIFNVKDSKEQFISSPLNTFDLMAMDANEGDGKIDISDEPDDDNLFGFGRGMGLEALGTHGSNTNLNSLLSIFGEAGVSSFMETIANKNPPYTPGNSVENKKKKVAQPSTLSKLVSVSDIISSSRPIENNLEVSGDNLFSETADGLVIPDLTNSQFPRTISKKKDL